MYVWGGILDVVGNYSFFFVFCFIGLFVCFLFKKMSHLHVYGMCVCARWINEHICRS